MSVSLFNLGWYSFSILLPLNLIEHYFLSLLCVGDPVDYFFPVAMIPVWKLCCCADLPISFSYSAVVK